MYYLIGKTLGHSYSAEIHRRFGRYGYELRSIPPEAVGAFFRERAFRGLNVTIPYKSTVMPYLDSIDDAAGRIGSVNTVENRGGRLIGHNTDYAGFLAMTDRAQITFTGKKVLILGSGGTSLTAQAVAADAGAREITVLSRRGENHYGTAEMHRDAEIIINATPVGMYPENGGSLLSLRDFPKLSGVVDVIYNPLRTKLLDRAQRLGIPATGGLYMLVAQAAAACEIFTGAPVSRDEIEDVYGSLLCEKENLILVGMPGCGKTTVAKLLAERMGRELADTDAYVEEHAGMPIPEIFRRHGEAEFRRLEREAVEALGKRSGIIIATGGGAVLDRENRYPLVQNGRVYFLERSLCSLDRGGRPLSMGADLAKMYEARLPHYLAFSDLQVENNGAPQQTAAAIMEDFYARSGIKRTES